MRFAVLFLKDLTRHTQPIVLAKMKKGHTGIPLDSEYYLYVLANFYLEPVRIQKQLNQPLTPKENEILRQCWTELANQMALDWPPQSHAEWVSLRNHYERMYAGANEPSQALLNVCLGHVIQSMDCVMLPNP